MNFLASSRFYFYVAGEYSHLSWDFEGPWINVLKAFYNTVAVVPGVFPRIVGCSVLQGVGLDSFPPRL